MNRLIIIGTSTTAKTVCEFVRKYKLYDVAGFAVNRPYLREETFCGLPVFAIEELDCIIDKEHDRLFVAIQWNRLNADRRKVFESLKAEGYHFANLVSPTAVVNGYLKGENCWIADMAVVDFGATIGDDVLVKMSAMVGPHTEIGSHCFIGAKSTVAGGVTIGEQSFVGLNATIFDCTTIGRKCIVGACSAVKRNMPDFTRCKTASDAVDFKQYSEDEVESKLMFAKNVRMLNISDIKMGGVKYTIATPSLPLAGRRLHDERLSA